MTILGGPGNMVNNLEKIPFRLGHGELKVNQSEGITMFEGIWAGLYATNKIASTTEYCISAKREKYLVFLINNTIVNKLALTGQIQILFKSIESGRCYGCSLHHRWRSLSTHKISNPVRLTHIYVIHDVNHYDCWQQAMIKFLHESPFCGRSLIVFK